ncbi:cytochrome c-type biogenesis protein [Zoogloea sp.]|uniref:cytochrome c-type biogenesis protein n=1 Tax=Zoogloea sp. TaxID=49181 RepID=UPI0035B2AE97
MTRRLLAPVAALLLAASLHLHAADATGKAEDPAGEHRNVTNSEEVRCLVCQNESLAASRAELANDLREEVRKLIHQGKSDAEIRDYLVARYGDFVLYRPPVKPTTWLLWFGPFALLAGGAVGLVAYLRRRAGRVSAPDLTAEQRAAADALLGAHSPQRPKNDA